MLKQNIRPLSHIGRSFSNQPNKTFSEDFSKQLKLNISNHPKKYYINIYNRNIDNSFTRALQQKKLFYHKIYNRNYGIKDKLGLTNLFQVKNGKGNTNINTPIRTKDFSSTRLSSSNTYKKINLKSKSIKKGQMQYLELEDNKSVENTFENDNKILSNNISKKDKFCEVNDEDFEQTYENKKINTNNNIIINSNNNNNNINTKKRPLSVSALINRGQFIEEKKDIKSDDLSPEMKIKNCFTIKFGYILNIFQKYVSNSDWIRMNYRTTFKNISTNLSKSFDTCHKILLDKIVDENCLQSFYNYCEEIINWQRMALDEIRYLKKENIYLIKKQKILDKEISKKKNEIKEINENIIKYDLNKVKQGKLLDIKVEKLKNNFNNIESNYILTIYQLQKEIEQLKDVLGEKKDEKINNDELKLELKNLREEMGQKTALYYKNEFTLNRKDKFNNLYIEELSNKNKELNNEIDKLKENEIKLSDEIRNLKIKLNRMTEAIREKENAIANLNNKDDNNDINFFSDENTIYPAEIKFISELK